MSNPTNPTPNQAGDFDSMAAEILANAIARCSSGKLFATDVQERPIITGTDADRDPIEYRHDLTDNPKRKNFDQKVYMFPESYNELRRELSSYWPTLWQLVQWRMAYRAEEFVEYMNEALDVAVIFDTEKVDFICKTYINLLRSKRGAAVLAFH